MKIDKTQAKHFWHQACTANDEVEALTVFGGIALGRGLNTSFYTMNNPESNKKVVDFLREWADSLEGS